MRMAMRDLRGKKDVIRWGCEELNKIKKRERI
jgi:hypothetical protein